MTDPTYDHREIYAEARGEDARDAMDDEVADWLAEDEFRGRW